MEAMHQQTELQATILLRRKERQTEETAVARGYSKMNDREAQNCIESNAQLATPFFVLQATKRARYPRSDFPP